MSRLLHKNNGPLRHHEKRPEPKKHKPIPKHDKKVPCTSYRLTPEEEQVLHLGLGFCPSEPIDIYETIKDLYLFARKLTFNYMSDPDRKCANWKRN